MKSRAEIQQYIRALQVALLRPCYCAGPLTPMSARRAS